MNLEINLFDDLIEVVKKYNEISRIQGDTYNIFQILNIEYDEARLHSRIIHDLLNVDGTHQQGNVFLKSFIDKFGLEGFRLERMVNTKREMYLGEVDIQNESGGYIDIAITNNFGQAIFIENKIGADDGLKQIIRYYNYGKNKYQKDSFKLIYLTLDGRCPKPHSVGNLKAKEHFHCISYENDIIEWLEECKVSSISKPLLRETITQYINTLKKMTNQSISHELDESLKNKIIENYKVANNINVVFERIKSEVNEKLHRLQNSFRGEDSPFKASTIEKDCFVIEILLKGIKVFIEVGFEFGEFYIGVYCDENTYNNTIDNQLNETILIGAKDKRFHFDVSDDIMIGNINNFINAAREILIAHDGNEIAD